VVDGRLIRGRRGLAAHFGHLLVGNRKDICFCGTAGCWEATASGTALQRRAREAGFDSLEAVFAAFVRKDGVARDFLDGAAFDLARGLVSVAHAFSPDLIILGGGVMEEFDTLEPMIAAHYLSMCLPAFRQLRFEKAQLGTAAGLVGMAHQALHSDKTSLRPLPR
jgi:glucokinase